MTKIILGADHGGYKLKEVVKQFLKKNGYAFEDLGAAAYDKDDDYVDYAEKVARKVVKEHVLGILVCRSAAGMVMAANKIKGVRAAAAFDKKSAMHSRQHNDANILALSGDWLPTKKAIDILKAWLSAAFSNEGRHKRRVEKIKRLEYD
ncbi:MAG: RpiB/LacA/LacB family sugar-phosphate isomerase [Candidatus Aenigmarchaeota archaeon]|nr:RpiB/LacA/LacB family sugar-phosphate isomerase [Candidatus Aenigmarchaeota archaeon]